MIKKIIRRLASKFKPAKSTDDIIAGYQLNGSVPWSDGYTEYKWQQIQKAISNTELLKSFNEEHTPVNFGQGLDERIIEYPWLLAKINKGKGKFLDAGSTFNFDLILQHPAMFEKDIYIYTYYPESNNFSSKRISYIYGDLRELPFKNDYFDQVACHSTLEHIDMDNSMYGYDLTHQDNVSIKSYDYLNVIRELERVVKPKGKILLTFPYGVFENHGFFQQFDREMVQQMEDLVSANSNSKKSFMRYEKNGWVFATQEKCDNSISYNPHTGKGKGDDNAAHSRAICFLQIIKNK